MITLSLGKYTFPDFSLFFKKELIPSELIPIEEKSKTARNYVFTIPNFVNYLSPIRIIEHLSDCKIISLLLNAGKKFFYKKLPDI
jgi:hypothetical protein